MPKKEEKVENANEEQSVFQEWADVTTAHGFLDFSHSKTTLSKIIWFILIFLSLSVMIYQLVHVVDDYSKHEWVSTIKEKASDVDGVALPSIIVCNVNRLKWSKARQYNMTLNILRYFYLQTDLWKTIARDNNASSFADQYTQWRLAHNFSFLDIFDKIGPDCEDIFLQDCNSPEYTVDSIFTYEYGRCYRINTNYISPVVGSQGGKSFALDVQGWDYVPLLYDNYASEGLVLQVTYSGNAELGQWIKLQPGTQTSISLQTVETTVQLQDRSVFNPFAYLDSNPSCALDPKLQFDSSVPYSKVACMLECGIAISIRDCGCVPLFPNKNYRTCEAEELTTCGNGNSDQYNTTEEKASAARRLEEEQIKQQECIKYGCPKPCYDRYLETQVSLTKFPSDRQRNQLQDYLNIKNLSRVRIEDIIYLEIYYSSLDTKLIERYESVSLDDLISNSGGLIGVWAGMSFLTVFQGFAYLIRFFEERKKRRMKKLLMMRDKIQHDKSMRSGDLKVSAPSVLHEDSSAIPGAISEQYQHYQ